MHIYVPPFTKLATNILNIGIKVNNLNSMKIVQTITPTDA